MKVFTLCETNFHVRGQLCLWERGRREAWLWILSSSLGRDGKKNPTPHLSLSPPLPSLETAKPTQTFPAVTQCNHLVLYVLQYTWYSRTRKVGERKNPPSFSWCDRLDFMHRKEEILFPRSLNIFCQLTGFDRATTSAFSARRSR